MSGHVFSAGGSFGPSLEEGGEEKIEDEDAVDVPQDGQTFPPQKENQMSIFCVYVTGTEMATLKTHQKENLVRCHDPGPSSGTE